MTLLLAVAIVIAVVWVLAYHRMPAMVWAASAVLGLSLLTAYAGWPQFVLYGLWAAVAAFAVLGIPSPMRRNLVSRPLLHLFRKLLPHVSQTEQEALDAGTVWWDCSRFLSPH